MTSGDDLVMVGQYIPAGKTSYSAEDVLRYLLGLPRHTPARPRRVTPISERPSLVLANRNTAVSRISPDQVGLAAGWLGGAGRARCGRGSPSQGRTQAVPTTAQPANNGAVGPHWTPRRSTSTFYTAIKHQGRAAGQGRGDGDGRPHLPRADDRDA